MDHSPVALEDGVDAERMRMNSFSFGKPKMPLDTSTASKPNRHSRSHSRNSSISVPPPLSFAPPLPAPSPPSSTSASSPSPPQSPTRNSLGGSKRNSHHRRRSSVSTRRESADLMGISLPALPPSNSEDNINFGDRDSVRRRALWALEGKTTSASFSVEIPELDATPEAPKRSFDFPSKPSFPPGVGAGFGGGLNTLLGSKRDSKFMASSPSSELLGTLVEEEEEEEEESKEFISSPVQGSPVAVEPAVTVTSPSPAPGRHRPASLNLRPLSLALSSSLQASTGESTLPSPSPSPRPGLRSLTLPSSQSLSGLSSNASSNKRQSLIMSSSSIAPSAASGRRPSLNLSTDSTGSVSQANRRSSISYVSSGDAQAVSVYGLPTPEMTPTSSTIDRRRSTSISSNGSIDVDQLRGRPLSVTEQHFLFQAHQTLVQRITDLERALKRSGPRSRPASCASDVSSSSSEPSDEMLQLIADLKAERDELKKDVDGWRTRVADMERQIDVHAKRLEIERRDAWVARQRLGLLEVEKSALEKTLADKMAHAEEAQAKCDAAQQDFRQAQDEITRLKAEVERLRSAEEEASRLRAELAQEKKKREELERELEQAGLLDTPRPFSSITNSAANALSRTMMYAKSRGLGFRSIDSDFTDVESVDENREPELKAVEEVDEDAHDNMYDDDDDEDDALAGYEDEDENDEYAFPTSSSYGSVADYSRSSTPRLSGDSAGSTSSAPALTNSRSPTVSPSPLPSPAEPLAAHARHASLSKAWSFPASTGGVAIAQRQPEEIDRFFGCLEDVDSSPPIDSKLRSVESGKNLFSQALVEHEDDLPPFVLPADVGEVISSPKIEVEVSQHTLDVVLEEEEEEEEEDANYGDIGEEFVGEEDEGGIKFVFDPPPSDYCPDFDADTSTPDLTMASTPDSVTKSGLFFESMDEDEDDSSFTFPQLKCQRSTPLPSAIPRLRSPSPSKPSLPPAVASTPVKVGSQLPLSRLSSSASFSTPPPKRPSAAAPTFIPQPRHSVPLSPSPPSSGKVASFIPQPKRASNSPRPSAIPVMSPTVSTDAVFRFATTVTSHPPPSAAVMKAPAVPPHSTTSDSPNLPSSQVSSTTTSPSLMSPTLARLSFQKLTNYIPVPSLLWSPRSGGGCFDASPCDSSVSSSGSPDHACTVSTFVNASAVAKAEPPRERTFVPKDKQLEKLRVRLEEERRRGAQIAVTGLGFEVKKAQPGVLNI